MAPPATPPPGRREGAGFPGEAEAEAEGRIPIPARWQPEQNPALCRQPASFPLAAAPYRPVTFPELPELLVALLFLGPDGRGWPGSPTREAAAADG